MAGLPGGKHTSNPFAAVQEHYPDRYPVFGEEDRNDFNAAKGLANIPPGPLAQMAAPGTDS
jgi:hypothetical protein